MQQLKRNLGLLFMLPLNRLYSQTQLVGKDSSVLRYQFVSNARIIEYQGWMNCMSHVDAQRVFLKLHELPDQCAKGFPVIPSLWQLFAELLNDWIKLLEECFSLQKASILHTLRQVWGYDRSGMALPRSPGA